MLHQKGGCCRSYPGLRNCQKGEIFSVDERVATDYQLITDAGSISSGAGRIQV